jgi:phosphoglycolate phosphatase
MEDNLFHALRKHCDDDQKATAASRHFLELLRTEYDPKFVPGMCDVVKAFAGNCSLAVLSSNSIAVIRRILTQANIAHCFSHVFGGDVEQDKRASVRRFLADRSYLVNRECSPAYREGDQPAQPTGSEIVLVTDTVGDVKHARECGIRAVGVAWGMHAEEELVAAGAEFVAVWPQELVAHLLPGGFAAATCGIAPPGEQAENARSAKTSCGCQTNEAVLAGELRRKRSIAAAAALAVRTCVSGEQPQSRIDVAPTAVAPKVDATLLESLGRLRGRIRNDSGETLRPA